MNRRGFLKLLGIGVPVAAVVGVGERALADAGTVTTVQAGDATVYHDARDAQVSQQGTVTTWNGSPDCVAAEGTALGLARRDHTHDIDGPVAPAGLARADHTHNITMNEGVISSINAGDEDSAVGNATTLNRLDFVHCMCVFCGSYDPNPHQCKGGLAVSKRGLHGFRDVFVAPGLVDGFAMDVRDWELVR